MLMLKQLVPITISRHFRTSLIYAIITGLSRTTFPVFCRVFTRPTAIRKTTQGWRAGW